MTTDENKSLVRSYIDTFSRSGEETVALLSDSATVEIMHRSSGIRLPQKMNKSEYLNFRNGNRSEMLPNGVRHEVHSMVAEGDWVTVQTESIGELSDGRVYNNWYHFAFEVRDGLIQSSREYTDFLYAKEMLFDSK
jgi:hypothetical protein